MKLSPSDILNYLGFAIPEDGITINPNDAFLHSEALRLLGRTLNVDRIPLEDLCNLHHGMAEMIAAWRGDSPTEPSDNSLKKLRVTIAVLLRQYYGLRTTTCE